MTSITSTSANTNANILTPQNVPQIFGTAWIPDNQIIYVRPKANLCSTNENNPCLKIMVRDMRSSNNCWMIAGQILSNNNFKDMTICFEYPRDSFMLKYLNKYFWVLVAVSKFKILLRQVRIKRDKKNIKLFLLSTKKSNKIFNGMSNFPIRKSIIDYILI